MGAARYFRNLEYRSATDTKVGQEIVKNSLQPLANAVFQEQRVFKFRQDGRASKSGVTIISVHHEKQALITVSMLVNALAKSGSEDFEGVPVTRLAFDIGERIRAERIHDLLRGRGIAIADELITRHRTRNAKRLADIMARKLDDPDYWAANDLSYHLGEILVWLAVRWVTFNGQPVFEKKTVADPSDPKKTVELISLTETAADWIAANQQEMAALASPAFLPMILPPRPWTIPTEGGYLMHRLHLVKGERRGTKKVLEEVNLRVVRSAVNAMQWTPWRFNKDTCAVIADAWDARLPLFGQKKWKQDGKEAHRLRGLEGAMAFHRSVTGKMRDEPRIYYPYQLDYRGRAYAVPQTIHPQADPVGKAPLEFKDGKPLGERGAFWLAIHLFNCYWKGKKVPLEQRLDWVRQNEREIVAFATNPLNGHRFLDEADKLWLFLPACREWKGYLEQGPGFVSHLPVSMDGSCNGYQHLSAMGLDPIGGLATNLLPGLEPQDIYQYVADLVSRSIEVDAANAESPDREAARQLLGMIDRGVVKPATMTTPYGVTLRTICEELLKDCDMIKSRKNPEQCAWYLAKLLEKCIPEVAVQAGIIMKWLRQIAMTLGKANRGMLWTTPSGFCVVHQNREPRRKRLSTFDRSLVIYKEDPRRKISAMKQANGIVAHLVHSFDAAHMILTVNRLYAEGIQHFAMVHDSFGVHAADVDLLNRILREEFVRIYSEPVLQRFLDEQRRANPDIVLPDCPELGDLDIREVLASPYFFA
jgi:DNA-directed RNA polymerase